MNLFGGFDDDLDNFAQYVNEEDEDFYEGQGDSGELAAARPVSFESDDESEPRQGGLRRLFQSFDKRRKKRNSKSEPLHTQQEQHPQQTTEETPDGLAVSDAVLAANGSIEETDI